MCWGRMSYYDCCHDVFCQETAVTVTYPGLLYQETALWLVLDSYTRRQQLMWLILASCTRRQHWLVLDSCTRRQQLLWLLTWPLVPRDSSECDCCFLVPRDNSYCDLSWPLVPGDSCTEHTRMTSKEVYSLWWLKCLCPLHYHLNQGKLNYDNVFVVKPSSETSVSILFLNHCVCVALFWAILFYVFLCHGLIGMRNFSETASMHCIPKWVYIIYYNV